MIAPPMARSQVDSEKNSLMPTPKSESANKAAQDGADDAEQQRDENATALLAREDCLSDCAGDEAQNQKCEKTHFYRSFFFIEETPGLPGALHPSSPILIMLSIKEPFGQE